MNSIQPTILNIPDNIANQINNVVTKNQFSWHFNNRVVTFDSSDLFFQFTHSFIIDSQVIDKDNYDIIKRLIEHVEGVLNLKVIDLYRVKANLMVRTYFNESDLKFLIHKDIMDDHKGDLISRNFISMVYYVINSDGDTILLQDDRRNIEIKSSPIANNILIFDSKKWHRSTPPLINKARIIINFILEVSNPNLD